MNTCHKAYTDDDISKEPVPLHLVAMQEYLRAKVRAAPDKSELSIATGVGYGRLTYFGRNVGTPISVADMQKLMTHFGVVGAVVAA